MRFKSRLDGNPKSNQEFFEWCKGGGTFHKSACIHPTAVIEKDAVVHSQSLLGANAYVGSGAIVGPGVTIGESTRIGYHNFASFFNIASSFFIFFSLSCTQVCLYGRLFYRSWNIQSWTSRWVGGVFHSCKLVLNLSSTFCFLRTFNMG